MSRILLTGGTGLIGQRLVAELRERGDEVTVLSRNPDRARQSLGNAVEAVAWENPLQTSPPASALVVADAVINLAGEPLAQRWSGAVKQAIRDSRVLATRNLVAGIAALDEAQRPRVLISGSAIGYYGPREDEELDESAAQGADFLAGVVADWEAEALVAQPLGLRVALARTGVVLSGSGGALAQMLPPFKFGVGGPVASGAQYVSWISLDDEAAALAFLAHDDRASGPFNLTAPEPVTNRELSKMLGHVLHRPAVMPVPGFAVKMLFGEMATVVIEGQRVVPAALQQQGFTFRHAQLHDALHDALGSRHH